MKNLSQFIAAAMFLIVLSFMPYPAYAAAGDTLRVTGPNVNLRERADITSPVLMVMPPDSVVTERSRQGEWVSVEVRGSGRQGWIHESLLVRVTQKPAAANEKAPAPAGERWRTFIKTCCGVRKHSATQGGADATPAGPPSPKQPVTKVGVVYLQRIIDESEGGGKTKKHFAEIAASTPAEDLKKIEQRLIRQVIEKIETIIAQYARSEGYTHVVDAPESGFLFADERFDITDSIIKLYNSMSAADAAKLPNAEKPAGQRNSPP